ncbi:uncharacterized protein LOC135462719 [Liolophura sinensis]|uniref:uncharacterized protein LOC135462719 n=1 Tax=Liolophura sinensis TaxID=3198878 RepID=UPI0031585360
MAEKSDEDSDHGDELSSHSIMQQIKRLEKEKADLEKRNSERNLLQEKLKELQGTVSALKGAPPNNNFLSKSPSKSPGTGRGKGKGRKNSPASYAAQFEAESVENHRTRSKSSKNRPVETEIAEEQDSDPDSEGDSEDDDADKRSERVMSAVHKQKLQEYRDTLVENMISEDIFNDLIANRILTTADVSRIKEKNTREAINEELLNNLIRRSDRAFTVFVGSLRKTLQGYLADLVEDKQKAKRRKRKRASGEMSVSVDVDEVYPRTKRKPPPCTCQQVEEQMLQMAKNAYKNIRRRDDTPASFEQFKKELGQTNTIIKDSMEIMHTLKILCRHGDIEDVSFGSVKFTLRFTSVKKLTNLWRMFRSGKLLDIFQNGLVTKTLLRRCRAKNIRLGVRIEEGEYLQCLRELAGDVRRAGQSSVSKYSRVAELQENIIPQENLSPQIPADMSGTGLPDTPTGRHDLSLSDSGPMRVLRDINRNTASSLSDIMTIPKSVMVKQSPKVRLSLDAPCTPPKPLVSRLRSHMAENSLQRRPAHSF